MLYSGQNSLYSRFASGPNSLWNGTRIGRMKPNASSQEPKLRALQQPNEKQAVCAEADRLSLLYSGS